MPTPFPETVAAFYDAAAERILDSELLFLNYGFEDNGALGEEWLDPADRDHRLHLNLIRHLLLGVELDGKSVLEVSCGRGGNCGYIAKYTGADSVIGVDRCVGTLRLSRDKPSLEGVTFLAADAEHLSFPAHAFDVVVNLEAAHCYGGFEQFLAEVFRVLAPGGMFCFADIWGLDYLDVDWIRREAEIAASGFEMLSAEDISKPVLSALERKDEGVYDFFSPRPGADGAALRARVTEITNQVRTLLALEACSYRLWRFQKP